jgi:hypothetical protein
MMKLEVSQRELLASVDVPYVIVRHVRSIGRLVSLSTATYATTKLGVFGRDLRG